MASVAGGAALAAYASETIAGGNFDTNFHSFFRISVSYLAGSALSAPGGVASAGGNGLQGAIVSEQGYIAGADSGLTIGSASTFNSGSSIAAHEFGHTLQFIGISSLSKRPDISWFRYLSIGAIGASLRVSGVPDSYNPIEFYH